MRVPFSGSELASSRKRIVGRPSSASASARAKTSRRRLSLSPAKAPVDARAWRWGGGSRGRGHLGNGREYSCLEVPVEESSNGVQACS